MEARGPFGRFLAGTLALAMAAFPIGGLIASFEDPQPNRAQWIHTWWGREILIMFAACFVFIALHYWIGPRPWIEAGLRHYVLPVIFIALIAHLAISAAFIIDWPW